MVKQVYIKLRKIKEKQFGIKVPNCLATAFLGDLFLTTERGKNNIYISLIHKLY